MPIRDLIAQNGSDITLSCTVNAFEELGERDATSTPSHCSDILHAPKKDIDVPGPYLHTSTPEL